jgi:hypothetical protein
VSGVVDPLRLGLPGILVGVLLVAAACAARAQDTRVPRLSPATMTLDTLVTTRGPAWLVRESPHFRVYRERPARERDVIALLDSLEDAWRHAATLLDARVADTPQVTVLVTRSRTRFAGIVGPAAKGLTTHLTNGGDVIVLVQNDSVRAYTRHEVMHLLASRAWGKGVAPIWLSEGLATFADGRCQRSTILAVARDLLRARPTLTATALQHDFVDLWRSDRYAAYVLAGSLVEYLWASHGHDGVRRLWQGRDTLQEGSVLPGAGGALTREWRAHVTRAAREAPGLDSAAFSRAGCG